MADFRSIRRSPVRVDGPKKVSGLAPYSIDVFLPGMLHAKALRSPVAHARIVSINTARAKELPGVHAVLTAADLPPLLQGRQAFDQPILAREKVRFIGEKVAAVAAESVEIAEEALELIEVEYEELPAVFDPLEALEPSAPILHENPSAYRGMPQHEFGPNVQNHVGRGKGDLKEGFAQADRIFEHTFRTASQHQVYFEPHVCVVSVEPSGKTVVWSSNKGPFELRNLLAEILQIPAESIRVEAVFVGGDFGGKGAPMDEPLCYFLAKATGRPVKMVMGPVEEFEAANPRHRSVVTVKTGMTNDGRIVARQAKVVFDSGAYAGYKPTPQMLIGGAFEVLGPYRIPNTRVDAYSVYTNGVPAGHMRAPGSPQAIFAGEAQIDIIARELGIDPLELRVRNAVEEGDTSPLSTPWKSVTLKETLRLAQEASGYGKPFDPDSVGTQDRPFDSAQDRPKLGPLYGIGIACCERHIGAGTSNAQVEIDEEGRVHIMSGTAEPGTGALTILRQIVAEALELPLDEVEIHMRDTENALHDDGSGASRVTHVAGQACLRAVEDAKRKLAALAEEHFEAPADLIDYREGFFFVKDVPERKIALRELARLAVERTGQRVLGTGGYNSKRPDEFCFATHIAEVEVDPESGQVRVVRYTAVQDVGIVINPTLAEGQVQGGVIQGIGFALMEELARDEGRVTNTSLADYKIPAMWDVPELNVILYEGAPSPGPYNAKSIAEICIAPVPAAVANAVFDATGVPVFSLPIRFEALLSALKERSLAGAIRLRRSR